MKRNNNVNWTMKKTIHIELYPRNQSCALQCAWCKFWDTWKEITNALDPKTKTTFDFIQNELIWPGQHSFTLNYNLPRNASILQSIPQIYYPELLDELSIGIWTIDWNKDFTTNLMHKVQQLLSWFNGTKNTLKLIFRRWVNNYTTEQRKHIFAILWYCMQQKEWSPWWVWIGLERNLANKAFDLKQYHHTMELQNQFHALRKIVKTFLPHEFYEWHRYHKKINKKWKDYWKEYHEIWWLCNIYRSYTRVTTPLKQRHVRINERVIQKTQDNADYDFYIRAEMEIDNWKNHNAHEAWISVFPRGVHLFHSSLDIDNPFFRCNHETFQDMVKQYWIEAPWLIVKQNLQSKEIYNHFK